MRSHYVVKPAAFLGAQTFRCELHILSELRNEMCCTE